MTDLLSCVRIVWAGGAGRRRRRHGIIAFSGGGANCVCGWRCSFVSIGPFSCALIDYIHPSVRASVHPFIRRPALPIQLIDSTSWCKSIRHLFKYLSFDFSGLFIVNSLLLTNAIVTKGRVNEFPVGFVGYWLITKWPALINSKAIATLPTPWIDSKFQYFTGY